MEKQRVNTAVTNLSNLIPKARVHVINHVTAKIKQLRKKDEKKNNARIERLLLEIAFLKKVNASRQRKMVARKILRNQEDHDAEIQSEKSSAATRAFHRLCKIECISSFVNEFRESNIDWKYWVPPLLDMWDKKYEIKKERSSSSKNEPKKKSKKVEEDASGDDSEESQDKDVETGDGDEKSAGLTASKRESIRDFVEKELSKHKLRESDLDIHKGSTVVDSKTKDKVEKNRGEVASKERVNLSEKFVSDESVEDEMDEEDGEGESSGQEEPVGDSEGGEEEAADESDDVDQGDSEDAEMEEPFRPYSLKEIKRRQGEVLDDSEDEDSGDEEIDEGDDVDEESGEEESQDEEDESGSDEEDAESGGSVDEESEEEDSEDEAEMQRKRKLLLSGLGKNKKRPLEIDFSVQKSIKKVKNDLDDPAISDAKRRKTDQKKEKDEDKESEPEDESDEGSSFFMKDGEKPKDVAPRTVPKENAPGMNRRERRGHTKRFEGQGEEQYEDEQATFSRESRFGGSASGGFNGYRGSNHRFDRGSSRGFGRDRNFGDREDSQQNGRFSGNNRGNFRNGPSHNGPSRGRGRGDSRQGRRSEGGGFGDRFERSNGDSRGHRGSGFRGRSSGPPGHQRGHDRRSFGGRDSFAGGDRNRNSSFHKPDSTTKSFIKDNIPAKSAKVESTESLHPSWQAKRQQTAAINKPFAGRRTVFD